MVQRGYTVYAPSINSLQTNNEKIVQCDLDFNNREAVKTFMEEYKFTDCIHLAWYVGKGLHKSNLNMEWLSLSLDMLKWFKENGGKRFLMAGSVSEYDFSYGYFKENATPITNHSIYGKAKAALDVVGNQYAAQNDIAFKTARIFNLYGPFEKPERIVPAVILSCLKNEDVRVSDCVKQVDYLHVYDMAMGIVTLFESDMVGAVNISSGEAVRLRAIVERIVEFTRSKSKVLWGVVPPSYDDPFVCGDNEKLRSLGWQPQFTLNEGLKQTISWWKENGKF
ncbi:MAG: NAD(P)-dependent oxidoreductase [Spirochaetaceae bacterium]|nr:NAD(P)-dependent oxidoreductase [Spirochaetaceae bacterium]